MRKWLTDRGHALAVRASGPDGHAMVRFVLIHVLLGASVLASYAHGIKTHPDQLDALWGTMPGSLRRLYQVWMLVAAASYFPVAYHFLTHRSTALFGGAVPAASSALVVDGLYVALFVASALWMPLTFHWLGSASQASYLAMRAVLTITAFASYALLGALLTSESRGGIGWYAAVVGHVLFTVQTGLLDPWIWPRYVHAG